MSRPGACGSKAARVTAQQRLLHSTYTRHCLSQTKYYNNQLALQNPTVIIHKGKKRTRCKIGKSAEKLRFSRAQVLKAN